MNACLVLARSAGTILDLPVRWLMNFLDAVIGDRGYLAVGSIIGGYLVIFGLIDAKHQQEEARASYERGQFVTLVTTGNAPTFVVAMKNFGPVQTMQVTEHPSLYKFWEWGRTSQPNVEPLYEWARARLSSCEAKDCSLTDARIDLRGADLRSAVLSHTDLKHADLANAHLTRAQMDNTDLSKANLRDAGLSHANLVGAVLTGAYLRNANLVGANLSAANLRDADLVAADVRSADLTAFEIETAAIMTGARYNAATKFPPNFEPVAHGMVRSD